MRAVTKVALVITAVTLAGCEDRTPAESIGAPKCVNLRESKWAENLSRSFGQIVCVSGPIYLGTHSANFRVDPPWGPPPYGGQLRLGLNERSPYRNLEPGAEVVATGVLLGSLFCQRNAAFDGCDRPEAKLLDYYLHNARIRK